MLTKIVFSTKTSAIQRIAYSPVGPCTVSIPASSCGMTKLGMVIAGSIKKATLLLKDCVLGARAIAVTRFEPGNEPRR